MRALPHTLKSGGTACISCSGRVSSGGNMPTPTVRNFCTARMAHENQSQEGGKDIPGSRTNHRRAERISPDREPITGGRKGYHKSSSIIILGTLTMQA
eukprot:1190707-Prorocentrum_minimum.AAC.2